MAVPYMLAADSIAGMICTTGAKILGDSVKQLTNASNESLMERVCQTYTRVGKHGGTAGVVVVVIITR